MKKMVQHPIKFFAISGLEMVNRMIRSNDRTEQLKAIGGIVAAGVIGGIALHLLSQLISAFAFLLAIALAGTMLYRRFR